MVLICPNLCPLYTNIAGTYTVLYVGGGVFVFGLSMSVNPPKIGFPTARRRVCRSVHGHCHKCAENSTKQHGGFWLCHIARLFSLNAEWTRYFTVILQPGGRVLIWFCQTVWMSWKCGIKTPYRSCLIRSFHQHHSFVPEKRRTCPHPHNFHVQLAPEPKTTSDIWWGILCSMKPALIVVLFM